MAKLWLIFCLISLMDYTLQAENIIVVYGASCSGKSTLSKAISDRFGSNWHLIDRDEIVDSCDDEELADTYLLNEIQATLAAGTNVVVDIQDPTLLVEALRHCDPFWIFVYASLPELIKRDQIRSLRLNRTEMRQYYARSYVYETFAALVTLNQSTALAVDSIDTSTIPNDIVDYDMKKSSTQFFQKCLSMNEPQALFAKFPCDVLIKSHSYSLLESVDLLQKFYESRTK